MQIDLPGRTVLLTGSPQGTGPAVATGLAGAGAAVVLTGRDAAEPEAVAGIDGQVTTVAGDVTTDEGTTRSANPCAPTGRSRRSSG